MFLFTWCVLHVELITVQDRLYRICENSSSTDVKSHVLIMNNDFPNASRADLSCKCIVEGAMFILPAYLSVTGGKETRDDVPALNMIENDARRHNVSVNDFDRIYRNFFRQNYTVQKLELEFTGSARLGLSFVFSVRPDGGTLDVTCMTSSAASEVRIAVQPDWLEKATSPTLVIFLGSLCVALLVVLMIVSLMLCCVMPRKQRREIKKIRDSMMILDADDNAPNGLYIRNTKQQNYTLKNTDSGISALNNTATMSFPTTFNSTQEPNYSDVSKTQENFVSSNFQSLDTPGHYYNTQRESSLYQNVQQQ